MDAKKGIPENPSIVMPRLFCRDAAAEMEFCSNTFGALELNRRPGPDGNVAHGLMTISGEMIMIEAEWPGFPARAPQLDGSSPVGIFVYVDDVDQVVERAVRSGAKILYPVQNQFWGDRMGWIMDPQGHTWTVATMEPSVKTSELESPRPQKRTTGWWLLLLIFVLIPIPWSPWWLTVPSLTICGALGWLLFGRKE